MSRIIAFLIAALALLPGYGCCAETNGLFGYVFAPDASYASVDMTSQLVSPQTALPGIRSINRVYSDRTGGMIFIQATHVREDAGKMELLEEVAVLAPGPGPEALQIKHWIRRPNSLASPVWVQGIAAKHLILVSWQDEKGIRTIVYDSRTYSTKATIDDFNVGPYTCIGSNAGDLYSLANNPSHEIKKLDLRSLKTDTSSYSGVGSPSAYYKGPVAIDGCTVALIEKERKDSTSQTVFIYDMETHQTLRSFPLAIDGNFSLNLNRNLILVDQKSLVPNRLPDGSIVGMRRTSEGVLVEFNISTGKQEGTIVVPRDGRLAGYLRDDRFAIYLSSNLISTVDLKERRISRQKEIPLPLEAGFAILAKL